ncbi:reverse transcriptase domain-containing protein [Tanacetum coccineum]
MVQPWQRITRQRITQSFSSSQEISFPPIANSDRQENPIVIEAVVEGHLIRRMYAAGGSASEVLYEHCFNRLFVSKPLHRITVHWPPGVLKNPSVPIHGTPTAQIPGRRGNSDIRRNTITPARMHNGSEDPQVLSNKQTTAEGIKVAIHPEYPKQTVTIGGSLSEKGKMELYDLLRSNLDIFTWKPVDMTGILRSIADHRLNVCERCSPIRQKRRGQAPDRNKTIQEEVTKLVEAAIIIREVHYHNWLSNPVMVKKHDVLPRRLQRISPDTYGRGRRIKDNFFCYAKMPIGLKNARATYQRLVDKAFERQIGHNLEVYVDDLVIKSHTEQEILRDVQETFQTLRKINMKLNPKKCTFYAEEGMLC